MKSEYLGLWKGRTAWYISKPITQQQIKEMPKKTRIILRYNKCYEAKSNKPKFIFAFADAKTADAIVFETEDYSDKLEEALDTIRKVQDLAYWGDMDGYDPSAKDACFDIDMLCREALGLSTD